MVGRLDGEDIGADPRIICDLSFCGKTSKWEGILFGGWRRNVFISINGFLLRFHSGHSFWSFLKTVIFLSFT